MDTTDAEELALNAVECMVAIMFDVPLDDIKRFSFEPSPQHPDGVRVELHLKSGEKREYVAKNPDAWTCAVEVGGLTGTA